MTKNYIMLTPAKNEENKLPKLVKAMVNQKLKPVKWLIVNDKSSDGTLDILKKLKSNYAWIDYICVNNNKYVDMHHKRIGYICKIGFERLISLTNQQNIEFDYLGKVDSDMDFPTNYFSKLVENLESNPEIGWIGGEMKIKDQLNNVQNESNFSNNNSTRGTGILIRKKAFQDIGGWPIDDDFAAKILLREKGWKLKRIDGLIYWQTRKTGAKETIKKGYISRGERAYYSYTNLLSLFMNIFSCFFHDKKKVQKAFYFLLGYFSAFVNRKERIDNEIVKKHNGSYKLFIHRLIKSIRQNK